MFLIYLLILFLVPFHRQEQLSLSASAYPSWFWEMPTDSNATYAVGYARRYIRIDTSYVYASRNCVWQLIRALQMTVDASQELYNQFGQNQLVGLQEVELIDSSQTLSIAGNYSLLDSAVVGDMVLALAIFSDTCHPQVAKERFPPAARPTWIDTPPQAKSVMYAVGTAPLYYYEHHSWERAEAHARFQLAYNMASQVQSVNWQEQASLQIWSETKTSIQLRHATIVNRWLDRLNRQCYVLCRMSL